MHRAVFGRLWGDAMYFFGGGGSPHIMVTQGRNAQKHEYLHAALQMTATKRKAALISAVHISLKPLLSGGAPARRNTE